MGDTAGRRPMCPPPPLVSGYKVATLSSVAILSTKTKTSTCRWTDSSHDLVSRASRIFLYFQWVFSLLLAPPTGNKEKYG